MRPILLLAAALILLAGGVVAADITIVVQKNRAFSTPSVSIARGGVVRFANEDRFRHQLYIDSPIMSFDSDEHDPGTTLDIPFTKAGTFEVRCHIHPKMLITVEVH
jgi:plastocyanin